MADRLHSFVARRMAASGVDDGMREILLRIYRGPGDRRATGAVGAHRAAILLRAYQRASWVI